MLIVLSTQIGDGEINSLPSNFFVNNLLSLVALHGDSERGNIECDNCAGADPPVSRCTACCHFLCEFCTQAHRRARSTRAHKLMSLEDTKKAGPSAVVRPSLCREHEGEMLKLFCETCDEAICRDCTIVEHRNHNYIFVKDAFAKSKMSMWKILEVTKSKVHILEEALKAVLDMKKSVKSSAEKREQEVKTYFKQCLAMLENRLEVLVSEINDAQRAKMNDLETQQEYLEMALGVVKSSVEFTQDAFENGGQVEVLSMKKQVSARLEELNSKKWQLEPYADDTFTFETGDKFKTMLPYIGNISHVTTYAGSSVLTMGHGSEGVMYNPLCGQLLEFTITAKTYSGMERIEGGDICVVEIQDPDLDCETVDDVQDNEDGTYRFQYTPVTMGQYYMSVKLNGFPLQGSPFTWLAEEWDLMIVSSSILPCLSLNKLRAECAYYKSYYKEYRATVSGSVGFNVGQHSWKVRISSKTWQKFGLGCFDSELRESGKVLRSDSGDQWTWYSASHKYQPSLGVQESLLTHVTIGDIIEVYLDCDNNRLSMYNQNTGQSDTWDEVNGEVFPVFYLDSCGDKIFLDLS